MTCSAVAGQFVPGHVFVNDPTNNFCKLCPDEPEHIWQMNPDTGEFSIFAEIPGELCGLISGMAFSPDGRRLRVSSRLLSAILEFDAQGNLSIALDGQDGIVGPEGCNNIAFDDEGNFYIPAKSHDAGVLKFPADGGAAIPLGDGIASPIAIAVAPDGDIYVTSAPNVTGSDNGVVRITPSGTTDVFDIFDGFNIDPVGIAVTGLEDIYVVAKGGGDVILYGYQRGDPLSRKPVLGCRESGAKELCNLQSIAIAPDGRRIYGNADGCIIVIDPSDSSHTLLGEGPASVWDCGTAIVPLRGDLNDDGTADLDDFRLVQRCLGWPDGIRHVLDDLCEAADLDPRRCGPPIDCNVADLDADGDVDLFDFRFFQWAFGGLR